MRVVNPTQPGTRLGMPVSVWPQADQTAWSAAFVPPGLLDDRPNGSGLRLPTRNALETCYARWLAWLKEVEPEALALPPEVRATRERVRAYVQALLTQLTVRTVYGYAARLKRALELLAPDADWSWMVPLLRNLEKRARKAGHTRPRPIVSSKQLFAYGIGLMKQADAAKPLVELRRELAADAGAGREDDPVLQAEAYRDGLAIAFLAARPLRLKNMLSLELGRNFLSVGSDYGVDLAAEEMKTDTPLAFPVPRQLGPYIRRYLERYRPVLAAGPHGVAAGHPEQADVLWLARSGQRFPVASFEAMIARRTTEQFGIRLTPHRFRHCAATTIAENSPEELHIIRIILGHTTSATAEMSYIETRNLQAFRMAQDNVNALSEAGGRLLRSGAIPDVAHDVPDPVSAGMIDLAGQNSSYTRRSIR